MRVLIVSDTHGKNDNFYKVVEAEKDISFIVHLGDLCGLEDYIEETTGIPCYAVRGNNDYHSLLPAESIIMLGSHRTLILHGHNHGVYYSTRELKRYAHALGCDIVLYGHTHVPEIDLEGQVTAVNPGSLTFPRQPGRRPTYIVAEIPESGEVSFDIRYLA